MIFRRLILIAAGTLVVSFIVAAAPVRADELRDIAFPVDGAVSFHDDFGEPRDGHAHEGIDLIGNKMMPLLSAVDGHVSYIVIPEESWGYAVYIKDADGYTYAYLHINNDTPGTDDGMGGTANAYAPGISRGSAVTRGQLIGWMGDSGNAENVGAHLHFEIRTPGGTPINPYPSLLNASQAGAYDPEAARLSSPDINADKDLPATGGGAACASGSLIKSSTSKAVYYCGADGKRYVFPNDKVYYTWYADFTGVTTVTAEALASLPLGGNATYRPGVKMVKIQSDPKVYAVAKGGVLRWIASPEVAAQLYGPDWAKFIDDVPDSFFINYRVGDPVTRAQ